jgi:NAD(P)-dependent dehydrogenase (short-subunit alcohol dehydrogenase family)
MGEFDGKVAIVTGAATGNGEAIAERLFRGGAQVVAVGHDAEGLARLARRLEGGGRRLVWTEGDVREPQTLQRAVEEAVGRFGGLHLAVNNVGITGPQDTPLAELSLEDWNQVIGTDLTGTFLSLKAEIPAIARSGGGAVVNLSSANGLVGVAGIAAYTCAKHGIVGLTRSVALECAPQGIRVNCIGPGYVATPRMKALPDDVLEQLAERHPMRRLASTTDVAEMAAFLLSERSAFCTGGFYPVDGGYTAQ